MAKTRVFSNPGTGAQTDVYHVVSRFVDRRKVFGDEERETFRAMMAAFAAFHQVEILHVLTLSRPLRHSAHSGCRGSLSRGFRRRSVA